MFRIFWRILKEVLKKTQGREIDNYPRNFVCV